MTKKLTLPKTHLSLNYHILKLITHSIYSIPSDGIYPPEVIEKTKQWLGISPFTKKSLGDGLKQLLKLGFISKERDDGRTVYFITDQGRHVYDSYVDVMTCWKIEKEYGKDLLLYTVSEVMLKSKKNPSTHIPECAFFEWPLEFKPTTHSFKGPKEIRSFQAFEKSFEASA